MKYVVYSCLFGKSLVLLEQNLHFKKKEAKYILFTDQNVESDFWEIHFVDKRALSDRKASRLAKISPSRWLPRETEISLYIDNSVLITGDVLEYFEKLNSADFMLFKHPSRNNVIQEVMHLNNLGHPQGGLMIQMLQEYETLGFDLQSQLGMGGILVRNHKNESLKAQEDLWLEQLLVGCERDQISLGFSLWRSEIRYSFVNENIRDNKFFKWPVR